ncbi:MAG: dihydroorotase, partial [Spirochaetota bacterium]
MIAPAERISIQGKMILPGMIDPHVHMRDMTLAYKETWESGSRAALAGGVTTVVDMPNTIPPLVSAETYDAKLEAAKVSRVNYGFHAGTEDRLIDKLDGLLDDTSRPVCGIKIFLASTSSNEVTDERDFVKEVMKRASAYGKVVLFHCELSKTLVHNEKKYDADRFNDISYHNIIRNIQCELDAIRLVVELVRETKARSYICHLSSAEGFRMAANAAGDGLPLYTECTPHHAFLSEDAVYSYGNIAKMNPPLRPERERRMLYKKLMNGEFDTYGTDHAPHTRDEKMTDYFSAPSGIPGLETGYHLLIDQMLSGHISQESVMELVAENPARIFGIRDRGRIEEGMWADIAIVDPDERWKVRPELFESKAKLSPFAGRELKGRVVMTIVNGAIAYRNGDFSKTIHGKELNYDQT